MIFTGGATMARRGDYTSRESKKPKKGAKKPKNISSILATPVTAEVIKKRKPKSTEIEEQEQEEE